VSFALYSPFAGKVEVDYCPGAALTVKTERPLPVESLLSGRTPLEVVSTPKMTE